MAILNIDFLHLFQSTHNIVRIETAAHDFADRCIKAENVANAAWEWTQADRVLQRWNNGVFFGIGLTYSFDRSDRERPVSALD